MAAIGIDILTGKTYIFPSGSLNNTVILAAAPGAGDVYQEGQIAVDSTTDTAYVLVDVTAGVATWQAIGAGGAVPDASETVKGILELATQAETNAGADDARAITPLKLSTYLASKSLITWTPISGDQAVTMGEGYIASPVGALTLTLPALASVGEMFKVISIGVAGTVKVAQNAGQSIQLLNTSSTIGAAGYIQTTGDGDAFTIICTVANTKFYILDAAGNFDFN